MVLEPGCITILRRGREHQHFPVNAFLWWRERVLHFEYWRQCLAVKSLQRPQAAAPAPSAAEPAAQPAPPCRESLRLQEVLSARLAQGQGAAARFAGYAISSVRPSEQPWLEIALEKGPQNIRLFIQAAQRARRAYASAGAYAVCYDQSTPLDSRDKRAAVEEFARYLAAA
jgi:hypothetical protein